MIKIIEVVKLKLSLVKNVCLGQASYLQLLEMSVLNSEQMEVITIVETQMEVNKLFGVMLEIH